VVSSSGRGLLLCFAAQAVVFAQSIAGVTVAVSPSAEYFEHVDEVLGVKRPPDVDAWVPYGVAITNKSAQKIVGLAVRWSNPLVTVLGGAWNDPRYQIAPGQTAIVTPVGWLPVRRQLPGTRLGAFQGVSQVDIGLDGVVFASGQFVGPNMSKAYEEFVAETTVPAHVAKTILAMRESGEAIGTVVAWLETNGRGHDIAARTSRSLANSYRRGGEAALYELAESIAKGPGIKVYR
jgi:hypothetical protein